MNPPSIVGVYRATNVASVLKLIEPALAAGWRTAWWALDEVPPALEAHTVGGGPGEKPVLLNRLLSSLGAANAPVVLTDDDIAFQRGDVVTLVGLCERAGLGIAQPAHGSGSHLSHEITRAVSVSRVRETTFVESGPLVVVMPEWAAHVLPLPDDRGMGWGLEFDWLDLRERGCRLGIVDATPIVHLAKVGGGYDDSTERARVRVDLAGRGVSDWHALQSTLATWRPWQRQPPWLGRSSRGRVEPEGPAEADESAPTILVDYWYSHAVGHVIEALRRCQGYHAGDPSARISLVLNGASPVALARRVPFVETVFGVRYSSFGTPSGDPMLSLRQLPRDWDYVLHHHAGHDEFHRRYDGLRRYYNAADAHFRARRGVGTIGAAPPPYRPHQNLRLELPDAIGEAAVGALGGRTGIAIILAGSQWRALYPSVASWKLILCELQRRVPDAVMVFIGRHNAADGGTVSGLPRGEAESIIASCPGAIDVFDRPVLEQLAAIAACDLLLSPHTGFAFAASTLQTPWLTLSGGDWHEYFFNGVPFVSVLPKSPEYPAFVQSRPLPMIDADSDGEGPRTATMSVARIREDLDELLEGAAVLLAGTLSYEAALADYFPRLAAAYRGDLTKIFSFEGIHRAYLPDAGATGPIV